MWTVAALTFASGLVAAVRMTETLAKAAVARTTVATTCAEPAELATLWR